MVQQNCESLGFKNCFSISDNALPIIMKPVNSLLMLTKIEWAEKGRK